jgi:hypothetical protein
MALTIDGSDPTGDLGDLLASKLNLAGGKILQIVRATDTTQRSTTSTSYQDTGMSVTITPQKDDSAILLILTVLSRTVNGTGDSTEADIQITDNSNNAISGAQASRIGLFGYTGSGNRIIQATHCLIAYATPATTSAVSYKARFKTDGAAINLLLQNSSQTGQLFAIEVSA